MVIGVNTPESALEQKVANVRCAVTDLCITYPVAIDNNYALWHYIDALAKTEFEVKQHWHKRIVRAGPNTVCIFAENPPVRSIAEDDMVFLDLRPVLGEWEADVSRTYVMGNDPGKHRLCRELP